MHKVTMAVVVGLALIGAPSLPSVQADEPIRTSQYLDIVRRAANTSSICHFDVFRRIVGTFTITGFRNKDGIIVREINGAHDAKITWFAPSQGTDYTFPFNAPVRYDYPEGGIVGAPATLSIFGLAEKVPGVPAEAGKTIFKGTVVEITPDGIPLVDTELEPVLLVGSSGNATPQNRCAALIQS